jgi:deoxycytidine triphosphate deaminase
MQLSDQDILKAIEAGEIEVDENFDPRRLQPASYDLTLGDTILRRKRSWLNKLNPRLFPLPPVNLSVGESGQLRVHRAGDSLKGMRLLSVDKIGRIVAYRTSNDFERVKLRTYEEHEEGLNANRWQNSNLYHPFLLMPGDFVLAAAAESIGPKSLSLVGNFQDKSTLARLGISTFFGSGLVDPGNVGKWTFEIKNNGYEPVPLFAGMRIAQITFTRLESIASQGYSGRYRNPNGVGQAI